MLTGGIQKIPKDRLKNAWVYDKVKNSDINTRQGSVYTKIQEALRQIWKTISRNSSNLW